MLFPLYNVERFQKVIHFEYVLDLYYHKVANVSPMVMMKKKDHGTCRPFLYHKIYIQVSSVMEFPKNNHRYMYLEKIDGFGEDHT